MPEDYYKALGVARDADAATIKKAFREKARQHHPDKGGDEKEFRKINEAYEVLSDKQKRAQYDQFGSVGGHFGGAGGFNDFSGFGGFSAGDASGFEDIFSSFFGGGGFGGAAQGQSAKRSRRGADLEVDLELTFEEAIKGVEKTFTSRHNAPCQTCDGKGGEGKKTCDTCGGRGFVSQQMRTPFGVVSQRTVCPACDGEGETFETPCKTCHGEGRTQQKIKITANIPAGVDDGETLRISGQGEAGRRGGAAGDFYVHIHVAPSDSFVRRGLDIQSILELNVFEALLGGTKDVKTIHGKVELTYPEGTKDGQILRLRGKGVERNGRSGDHLVRIEYIMPKKITPKLKELLEQAQKEV